MISDYYNILDKGFEKTTNILIKSFILKITINYTKINCLAMIEQ